MSGKNQSQNAGKFDEYRPFAGPLGDKVSECVDCGRMKFDEYADEGGVCRRCRSDELLCLGCKSTVVVEEAESDLFAWQLCCVSCGVVPSVDVRGDLSKAMKAAEEAAGDGGDY